ncbi:T9SS type A sorting domain-containing protein [Polaribacter tangerinus]|uniref:T9SS type A sorting domain-containing protein n=1 Tax=Polaribacter tangerinus TaxID=1920034 RepID=UPI000B4BA8DF|nr:T9SS type A sorting domain-containing protein [Polaribacter tangerinus]
MKISIAPLFFLLFLHIHCSNSFAQEPSWSVNPSDFQYSMTITAFLNIDGENLTNTNDKVAAFVDGEIRGIGNVSYNKTSDKHLVYLTIFGNKNGEIIQFKIYDSSKDRIVNALHTEIFDIDVSLGTVFQSYCIANSSLSATAKLLNFDFKSLNTKVRKVDNQLFISVPYNTDVSALTPVFSVSEGANVFVNKEKQFSGRTQHNFEQPVVFEVVSQSQKTVSEYLITIEFISFTSNIKATLSLENPKEKNKIPVVISAVFDSPPTNFTKENILGSNWLLYKFHKITDTEFIIEVLPYLESVPEISLYLSESKPDLELPDYPVISNTFRHHIDTTAPIIKNITLKKDTNKEYFEIEFNEEVRNVKITDFKLTGTLASNYSMLELIPITDKKFNLIVETTSDKKGTINLTVNENTSISDVSNNLLLKQHTDMYYLDMTPPTLLLQDIYLEIKTNESKTISFNDIDKGSFDNLEIASIIIDKTTFTIADSGTNSVLVTATDSVGNTTKKTINVVVNENSLSINDSEYSTKINVYPNPTKNSFTLKSSSIKIHAIEMYNSLGLKVNIQSKNSNNIEIGTLKNGVYLLKIHTEEHGIIVKKIIKK